MDWCGKCRKCGGGNGEMWPDAVAVLIVIGEGNAFTDQRLRRMDDWVVMFVGKKPLFRYDAKGGCDGWLAPLHLVSRLGRPRAGGPVAAACA